MEKIIQKITLFGSGNVATQLGLALKNSGIEIVQVWSKNFNNAKKLAKQLECRAISKFNQLRDSDLYIVSITDDAIIKFIHQLPHHTPVVHTSGNTSLVERLNDEPSGVFYPLQTFSKSRTPHWNEIPICIEASDDHLLKQLFILGENLSSQVKIVNSKQRAVLHTAAVIACNFSNHMGALAEDVLNSHNLDLSLLRPLIDQTFKNISSGNVKSKQTGPAVREDYGTMDAHLSILADKTEIKELYLAISRHIINYHHGE